MDSLKSGPIWLGSHMVDEPVNERRPHRLPKIYGPKPGARRRRMIRRSVLFWEKFGVVVSCIATAFAAAAVWSSLRQTDLMAEAIYAGERSSAFAKMSQSLDDYCELVLELGFHDSMSAEEVNALQARLPSPELIVEKGTAVRTSAKLLLLLIDESQEEALHMFATRAQGSAISLSEGKRMAPGQLAPILEASVFLCVETRLSMVGWFKRKSELRLMPYEFPGLRILML